MSVIEEDYFPISGIQHFAFCVRQWALIRMEGVWAENYLTAQGRALHQRVDDPWLTEAQKGKIVSRAMPIRSEKLRLQGVADIVELTPDANGVSVPGRDGLWALCPVEYKRGKPKSEDCDAVQLCAQAMCLEEMLGARILRGEIFYGQPRRRTEVFFDERLRDETIRIAGEMGRVFDAGVMPVMKKAKHCKGCSLVDICSPELSALRHSVDEYVERALAEQDGM